MAEMRVRIRAREKKQKDGGLPAKRNAVARVFITRRMSVLDDLDFDVSAVCSPACSGALIFLEFYRHRHNANIAFGEDIMI